MYALATLVRYGGRAIHGASPASRRLASFVPNDRSGAPVARTRRADRGCPPSGASRHADRQARSAAGAGRLVAGLRQPAGGRGGQPRLRRGAPVADRGAAAAALSPGTPTRPVIAGAGPA